MDGITYSMDMSLSKLQETVRQGSLVCCSPWGCKESDMTEQLNSKLGSGSPPRSQHGRKPRDEPVLLGRACVSTPAHGTVATGTSKDQAPDTAPTLTSHQSCPPPGLRSGYALMLQAQVRSRCLCLALTDDLALPMVARWPKWPRCQGFLLGSTANLKCANPHGVSVGSDDDPAEPSALRAFPALSFRPKCNLKKPTEL